MSLLNIQAIPRSYRSSYKYPPTNRDNVEINRRIILLAQTILNNPYNVDLKKQLIGYCYVNLYGFHGIAVSKDSQLSATGALSRYKDLWHVEEVFRVAKCTLKTRPIFHWSFHRIRAHILLCFITLFFERFLELLLRQNKTPLSPDRIRFALSGVHSTYFEDTTSNKTGRIKSSLTEDAQAIFQVLELPLDRSAEIECCV